jgi:hypothetical protein
MAPRISSWLARPALLRSLVARLRVAGRLLREPAVPLGAKALTLVPLLYVLSPLDLLPDFERPALRADARSRAGGRRDRSGVAQGLTAATCPPVSAPGEGRRILSAPLRERPRSP